MKKFLVILLLLLDLTGCVGFTVSGNGEVVNQQLSPADFKYANLPSDQEIQEKKTNPDGTTTYIHDEVKWCGLTVFAIVPVPLWLPVCHNHYEITYKDGKGIKTTSQYTKASGSLCGPFVPMIKMNAGFCQTHNDW